jgi:hypothetical protein
MSLVLAVGGHFARGTISPTASTLQTERGLTLGGLTFRGQKAFRDHRSVVLRFFAEASWPAAEFVLALTERPEPTL